MQSNRNLFLIIIAVLTTSLAVAGYALYEEKKQPDGVEIKIGENGLSIEGK